MRKTTEYACATMVLLVLLRLAIGWHFLFEGSEKRKSETWSSEGYLREASGPLAPFFRKLAGDTVADRLTPLPLKPAEDPTKAKLHEHMPPPLDKEWNVWFEAFVKHFKLDDDQKSKAQTRFEQRKGQTVDWMMRSKKSVATTSPVGPPIVAEKTVAQRIADYQKLLDQAYTIEAKELREAGDSLSKAEITGRIRTLKSDANRMRTELKGELNAQTQEMRESVREVLTPKQYEENVAMATVVKPGLFERDYLGLVDTFIPLALVLIGLGLLLGLFTRTFCILGAILLLSFYLAMPPWPGTPENPKAEGHYLFINKNIVEMLALLMLATTPSGFWAGLDGVIRLLLNNRKRRSTPATVAAPVKPQTATV